MDVEISNSKRFLHYINSVRNIYKKQSYVLPLDNFWISHGLAQRAVPGGAQRNLMAMPAGCTAQPTVVPLALSSELRPGQFLYPDCTRLARCSGCCSHPLLSCRPTETENILLDLILVDTVNQTDKIVTANLTEHKACGCQCAVQEVHCSPAQYYVPEECSCRCRARTDCRLHSRNSLWDETSCSCRCSRELDCPTGTIFSFKSCR